MKKHLIAVLFGLLASNMFGQETSIIPTISFPNSVDLFGLYEISLTLSKTYQNPYDPDTILIYGVFTGPNNSSDTVHAFYHEGFEFQS